MIDDDLTERIERPPLQGLEAPRPFEASLRLDFQGEAGEVVQRFEVPAEKQLVLESLTARLLSGPSYLPRGRVVLVVNVRSLGRDRMHCFRFVPPAPDASRPDPVVFRKTHFFADAGTRVEVVFIREEEKDARSVVLSIRGTLVSDPGNGTPPAADSAPL